MINLLLRIFASKHLNLKIRNFDIYNSCQILLRTLMKITKNYKNYKIVNKIYTIIY